MVTDLIGLCNSSNENVPVTPTKPLVFPNSAFTAEGAALPALSNASLATYVAS